MHAPWMHQPSYTYAPRPDTMLPPHGVTPQQGHGQLPGPSGAPQAAPKQEKALASKLSKKVTKVTGHGGSEKHTSLASVGAESWGKSIATVLFLLIVPCARVVDTGMYSEFSFLL